jgi:hypothetical protein
MATIELQTTAALAESRRKMQAKRDNEQDQTQFHQRRYVQAAFRFREFIGQRRGNTVARPPRGR